MALSGHVRMLRAALVILGTTLCVSLLAVEPPVGPEAGLEKTVVALRDALQRGAAERGVDRAASLARIDELLAAGRRDPAQAAAHLNEAYALVRSEIRLLGNTAGGANGEIAPGDPASAASSRRAFERQRASAVALGEAFTRIAAEGKDAAAQQQAAEVTRRIAGADQRAAAGDWDEARRTVEQALELAKQGIRGLREGTTQVRALAFASAEDEYRYEVDRHDSYRMLLKMLAGDVSSGDRLRRADELLRAAQERAGSGDFAQAVKLMEQASEELQRVIRAAGLYLPG